MKEASSVKTINAPIERVYNTLSNLENLRPVLDKIATDETVYTKLASSGRADVLNWLKDVVLTKDRVEIQTPMTGNVSMVITEREENKCIRFETEKSPINAKLWVQVLPQNETTALKLTVDANIPVMLRPMVGAKMKNGVEKLADVISMIKY